MFLMQLLLLLLLELRLLKVILLLECIHSNVESSSSSSHSAVATARFHTREIHHRSQAVQADVDAIAAAAAEIASQWCRISWSRG